jgi:uncharacterized cupredoxin-like copper-binding protein
MVLKPYHVLLIALAAVALSALMVVVFGLLPLPMSGWQNAVSEEPSGAYAYRWGGPMMGWRGQWMWRQTGWCPCMAWMWGSPATPPPQQRQDTSGVPDVELTIYAGEAEGRFGFGLSRESISSPGPTITLKKGSLVKVTLINVGVLPHALIISEKAEDDPYAEPSFAGAVTGIVSPGRSETIYFVVDKAGVYYYSCNIPGHVSMGMWGELQVSE